MFTSVANARMKPYRAPRKLEVYLPQRITRRDALLKGAAAVPLAAAGRDTAVSIGIATTQFRRLSNSEVARLLREQRVRVAQLFFTQTDSDYWKYNGRNNLSDLTPGRCAEIAGAYRSEGVGIHSLGVYTNLIHPEESERRANLSYFEAMMKVGGHMGVRTFISEAGHYHPKTVEPGEPHHWKEPVWRTMVATAKELARVADAHDAVVLLEPYFQGFLATAKRTRMFLEEVGSPRIRALLDPANLLEVDDVQQMFDQLGPWIDCFHAKDRKLHVTRGVAAGEGDLDYRKFVSLAAQRRPGAPLILEYVGAENFVQALAHLRGVMRDLGLRERAS